MYTLLAEIVSIPATAKDLEIKFAIVDNNGKRLLSIAKVDSRSGKVISGMNMNLEDIHTVAEVFANVSTAVKQVENEKESVNV